MDECFICGMISIDCCCNILERHEKFKFILVNSKKIVVLNNDGQCDDLKTKLCVAYLKIEKIVKNFTLNINPSINFNNNRHIEDQISKKYLNYCDNLNDLSVAPLYTIGDGNCLYNSILNYVIDENVTVYELRVRVIVSMIKNWDLYESIYQNLLGPITIYIKNVVTMGNYSELYELIALCNVLDVNIQSIYPKIQSQTKYNQIQWTTHNQLYTNIKSIENTRNQTIFIMWTNTQNKENAQFGNNKDWSPNHFIPLLKIENTETTSSLECLLKQRMEPRNLPLKISNQNLIEETTILECLLKLPNEDEKQKVSELMSRKRRIIKDDQMIKKRKNDKKLLMRKRRLNESVEKSENRKCKDNEAKKRRRFHNPIKQLKRFRKEETTKVNSNWPSITPDSTKLRLLKNFIQKMSKMSVESATVLNTLRRFITLN